MLRICSTINEFRRLGGTVRSFDTAVRKSRIVRITCHGITSHGITGEESLGMESLGMEILERHHEARDSKDSKILTFIIIIIIVKINVIIFSTT